MATFDWPIRTTAHIQKHFAFHSEFGPLDSWNLVNFHLSHLSTEETLPTLVWGSLVVLFCFGWLFGVWGVSLLFLPPPFCSVSLLLMMTWAHRPHGVRTRGIYSWLTSGLEIAMNRTSRQELTRLSSTELFRNFHCGYPDCREEDRPYQKCSQHVCSEEWQWMSDWLTGDRIPSSGNWQSTAKSCGTKQRGSKQTGGIIRSTSQPNTSISETVGKKLTMSSSNWERSS